jgi:hypothetical protein
VTLPALVVVQSNKPITTKVTKENRKRESFTILRVLGGKGLRGNQIKGLVPGDKNKALGSLGGLLGKKKQ